jgi:hypothetical protein
MTRSPRSMTAARWPRAGSRPRRRLIKSHLSANWWARAVTRILTPAGGCRDRSPPRPVRVARATPPRRIFAGRTAFYSSSSRPAVLASGLPCSRCRARGTLPECAMRMIAVTPGPSIPAPHSETPSKRAPQWTGTRMTLARVAKTGISRRGGADVYGPLSRATGRRFVEVGAALVTRQRHHEVGACAAMPGPLLIFTSGCGTEATGHEQSPLDTDSQFTCAFRVYQELSAAAGLD